MSNQAMALLTEAEDAVQVFLYGGILMFGVLALAVAVLLLRRALLTRRRRRATGFSIESLSDLRREGQISDEEYARLRRRLLGVDAGAKYVDNPSAGARDSTLRDELANDDGTEGPGPQEPER
jgi:hypothetical protein